MTSGKPAHITGPRRPTKPGGRLTGRQIEILTLAANGYTAQQIARRLDITAGTVHERLHRIYVKLGARNIAHAATIGTILQLVDPADIDIPAELKEAA